MRQQIGKLYAIKRLAEELSAEDQLTMRLKHSQSILGALHEWLQQQRQKLLDSPATEKALDYSLKHWAAQTRFTTDEQLPVENRQWFELTLLEKILPLRQATANTWSCCEDSGQILSLAAAPQ